MSEQPLPLAITPGEPAGIGPDLLIKLVQQPDHPPLVAVADSRLLLDRARQLRLPLRLLPHHRETVPMTQAAQLSVVEVPLPVPCRAGMLEPANSTYVLDCLRRASAGCVSGEFAALITGPVHKGIINDAGIPFTGHTEFLAKLTDTEQVVMMLATPGLRVALVTTHLPLKDVAAAITPKWLQRCVQILNNGLQQQFGLAEPKILVCGLNPHAGEDGHLGREEIDIIIPVLDQLRNAGLLLRGPLPADTLFTPGILKQADAVLAMYHDQGLPVLKHLGFGKSVNITLGLPIIRTSVDHGTALELAGRGQCHTGSLAYAVEVAEHMARRATSRTAHVDQPSALARQS